MRTRQILLASSSLTLIALAATAPRALAQQIPAQLQPPANEQLLLQVHAKGDQIYTCKEGATAFVWELKAPDAQLFDKDGKRSAHYVFLSPSDVLKISTAVLLVGSRNGKATPGSKSLEVRTSLLNRYANQIMQVPVAKVG